MHLGKVIKFNIILAILLCMAFAVNLGSTFAIAQYLFKTKSINTIQNEIVQNNVYTDYGYAQGTQGKYVYSPGLYNNQLSINYGFREDYDLIIRFSATYTNELHSATDFSLNFSNRDKWLVDMGSTNGLKIDDGQMPAGEKLTIVDEEQIYYNLTSSSNTITGVMYYMGKISGSGTMPIISGVNFYTSPNDSYNYIGDTLTVTLTPEYVKSSNYSTSHAFNVSKNGFTPNAKIFDNWASYMSETIPADESAQYMIYNAYMYDKTSSHDMSLKYPVDKSLINEDTGMVDSEAGSLTYANTSYRYTVTDGIRSYEALTAGNKYYGGLGVYVIPNSQATNKLVTVGITVRYVWQKDGEIAGFSPSGVVTIQTSNDITTISKDGTNYHYYKSEISSPTYINVLDYIMLTAENYEIIVKSGYSLILNYISVSLETDTNNMVVGDGGEKWVSQENKDYTINNSTHTTPLLARATNITTAGMSYETDISITNNSDSVLKVTSFSVKGYLWYSAYTITTEDNDNGGINIVEHFVEMPLGGEGKTMCYLRPSYLKDQDPTKNELAANGIWKYNEDLWSVSYSDNTYTFNYNAGVAYIPSGYTMPLINGVKIPKTTICQNETTANDFWCNVEVVGLSVEQGTPTYTNTSTGLETIVEGYYTEINSQTPGKIYVRNNTNQEITKLTLSNLEVCPLSDWDVLPRDRADYFNTCSYDVFNHLNKTDSTSQESGTISIKPNETVLVWEINPASAAIIYNYKVTATLGGGEYNCDINLVYNAETNKGEIVNKSSKFYEFRLTSSTQLNLANDDDFIKKQDGTKYYYYYKGIICPNQCITILNGDYDCDVVIQSTDMIEHDDSWGMEHYISSNYESWGLDEDDEWLLAMKSQYSEPTADERQNAIKLN